MDIRLVRIDDRLIHGQVTTVWTKQSKVNRILVVSDEVAKDTMRKFLLTQAAPPDVKVNVISIDKLIEVSTNPLLTASTRAMLLFTNPTDVRRVVDAGIPISAINIGAMSYRNGKKMITSTIAVDQTDINDFMYLYNKGIKMEIRKVISDTPIDLIELLNKKLSNHLKLL